MVTPDLVRRVLREVGQLSLLLVIIDEFDTIVDNDARQSMADTIKYLSDKSIPCTVIVVGVADDVETLIADHQSIERCLIQVRMPRMSRSELEAIVSKSLGQTGMMIDDEAQHEVSRIAKGLPHYAHLLGLHASTTAANEGYMCVKQSHVSAAVAIAIEAAQVSVQQAYRKATSTGRKNALFTQTLTACALAETDEFGYFAPYDVRLPLTCILKRPAKIENFSRHLHTFSQAESGPVLKKIDFRGHPRFRFVNALMQPFALMKGLADRVFTEADLKATKVDEHGQKRLF